MWTSSRVYVHVFVVFFIYHHGLGGALVENAISHLRGVEAS